MNIEELKKRVRGNGFQESHGSTTMVIDVETVIDLLDDLAAINFTGSSLELKEKYTADFEYFVNNKVNVVQVGSIYWFKDIGYTNLDKLFKEYQKITKPLIT